MDSLDASPITRKPTYVAHSTPVFEYMFPLRRVSAI